MKKNSENKPKLGRPPKLARDKFQNQVRQIGRWDDESWDIVRRAAAAEGLSVAAWARESLLRAAKRAK